MAIGAPERLTEHLARAWESEAYDQDMLLALETLRVGNWVYLKDTRYYSVFLSTDGETGYAVLSLLDRIRDLVGGSGMALEAGIVKLGDRYVCDGLLANPIVLGPNYLRSYRSVRRVAAHRALS